MSIEQDARCTEQRSDDGIRQSCELIAGRYSLRIGLPRTPGTVGLNLDYEHRTLLSTSQDLVYEEYRPNGPQCEPVCIQSNLELTVP